METTGTNRTLADIVYEAENKDPHQTRNAFMIYFYTALGVCLLIALSVWARMIIEHCCKKGSTTALDYCKTEDEAYLDEKLTLKEFLDSQAQKFNTSKNQSCIRQGGNNSAPDSPFINVP